MSVFRRIHKVRGSVARRRQPDFLDELDRLDAIVEQYDPPGHPYNLSPVGPLYRDLATRAAFLGPSQGRYAGPQESEFVYRYKTLGAFAMEVELSSRPQEPALPGQLNSLMSDEVLSQITRLSLGKGRQWVPLAEIAKGGYRSRAPGALRRYSTWWSDESLDLDNVIRDLNSRGIPSTWMAEKSILMRLRIDSAGPTSLHIPSPVDGYDSPVFVPADLTPPLAEARALDIGVRPFRIGKLEFVAEPLPVEGIDVSLLELPADQITSCPADLDKEFFLEELEAYYGALA